MATVLTLVTDSLRNIGIIGETQTPSAEEGADAVTKLNDLMASLEEDGINLGWNPKASTADSYVLPLGHVDGVKAMLSVKLAGAYGVDAPPVTAAMAASSYQRLLGQALHRMMRESVSDSPRGENNPYRFNILTGS